MSGLAQYNFPAFFSAEAELTQRGYNVRNPAAHDPEEVQKAAWASKTGADPLPGDHTWGDILANDVRMLSDDCGGVILLDNWEQSKGARLEATVAMLHDYPIYRYIQTRDGYKLELVDYYYVATNILWSFQYSKNFTEKFETDVASH
jgi:hypothetical protein